MVGSCCPWNLSPPFFLYLQVAISGQLSASLFYVSLESNGLIGGTWKDLERIWLLERQLCGPCPFEMVQRRRVCISSPRADTVLERFCHLLTHFFLSTSWVHTYLPPSVFFICNWFMAVLYFSEVNRSSLNIVKLSLTNVQYTYLHCNSCLKWQFWQLSPLLFRLLCLWNYTWECLMMSPQVNGW